MAISRVLRIYFALVLALLLLLPHNNAARAEVVPLDGVEAVCEPELETMRGGMSFAGGLEVSVGIELVTFIDGILQTASILNISSLTNALQGQLGPQLAQLRQVVDVLQAQIPAQVPAQIPAQVPAQVPTSMVLLPSQASGVLTTIDLNALTPQLVNFIQNRLDHKVIDHQTILNLSVTSRNLHRDLNQMLMNLNHQALTLK